MPTSFRPPAAPSRHNNHRQQQSQHTISPRRTRATTAASNTSPSTRPRSASAPRLPGTLTAAATQPRSDIVDLTALNSDDSPDAAHLRFPLFGLDPHLEAGFAGWQGEEIAAAVHAWDWIIGASGSNEYVSADDEDFDDESVEEDEDLDEDEDDDEEDEDDEEEEEDDVDDDLFDHDDFMHEEDLLALLQHEAQFLEPDLFLGGQEDEDLFSEYPGGSSGPNEEPFDAFAANEFSSPSTHPSIIHGPSWQLALDQAARQNIAAHTQPTASSGQRYSFASPSRTTTQTTNLSTESASNNDHQNEGEDNTPNTSFSDDMPTTRRGSQHALHSSPPAKRRRTSNTHRTSAKPDAIKLDDDDLFGDSPAKKATEAAVEDLPAIDLTSATEVPEELNEPVKDNRIKLAAFQCVICMDDVSSLTVTHCGHLYCAECLHSSIHTGAMKGRCPMCRQKLDFKPRASYNSKSKGYWPLELKIMTSTRKGKRKAGT